MSSAHLQQSRGFPHLAVGRKGDVSYYEEEEEETEGLPLFSFFTHAALSLSLKAQLRCSSA